MIQPENNANRLIVARVLSLCILLILFGRIFYMQIIDRNFYSKRALANSIRIIDIPGLRGVLTDRNGKTIAENTVSYSLFITPKEFGKDFFRLRKLCELLSMDSIVVHQKLFGPSVPKNRSVRVLRDISFSDIAKLEEMRTEFPGISIEQEAKRHYTAGVGSHFLGYVSEPNEEEVTKNPAFHSGTMIGRRGIEKTYDSLLRGVPGARYRLVDVSGRELGALEEMPDLPPGPGIPLRLGIDLRVQAKAESLLAGKSGAVVAIEPKTGEIICLASAPTFPPQLFDGAISGKVWSALSEDPEKPLFNRAMQAAYPPGSTFKMTTLTAGLENDVIDTNATIFCGGAIAIGNRVFKDSYRKGHGSVKAQLSIAASCDVYYYVLGQRVGLGRLYATMNRLGFGKKTGVDLDAESAGLAPSAAWYEKRGYPWGAGTMANLGIGQGEILVTPMQQACYASMWANGGWYMVPHIVAAIGDTARKGEWKSFQPKRVDVQLQPWVASFVRRAMRQVVEAPNGTAHRFESLGYDAAGKTGTAQNPHGKDHAWFICFAPFDDPKIAIAVLVENAGWGSVNAAPIAFDLIGTYLGKSTAGLDIGNAEQSSGFGE